MQLAPKQSLNAANEERLLPSRGYGLVHSIVGARTGQWTTLANGSVATSLPVTSQISIQHAPAGPLICPSRIIARASDSSHHYAVFNPGIAAAPILEQGLVLSDVKVEMAKVGFYALCRPRSSAVAMSRMSGNTIYTPCEAPCFEHQCLQQGAIRFQPKSAAFCRFLSPVLGSLISMRTFVGPAACAEGNPLVRFGSEL